MTPEARAALRGLHALTAPRRKPAKVLRLPVRRAPMGKLARLYVAGRLGAWW